MTRGRFKIFSPSDASVDPTRSARTTSLAGWSDRRVHGCLNPLARRRVPEASPLLSCGCFPATPRPCMLCVSHTCGTAADLYREDSACRSHDDVKATGPDRGRRADEILTFNPEPAENAEAHRHAGSFLADSSIVLSLEEFVRAVTEFDIADVAELQALAADPVAGVLGLSRRLVNAGKLTPYQAAALSQTLLIGNYLILDMLGQGGIGSAFRARHRQSGRIGALKVVPATLARQRNAVMRLHGISRR